ncbi:efflux RND transporter periplasmic adaptor subunit [Thalassotalea fusca]
MKLTFRQQVVAFTTLVFTSLSLFSHAQQMPPASVNVAIVESKLMSPIAWVSGNVVSKNNAKLAAEVSGRLVTLVEVGAQVTKGQVIAQLDDRTLRHELAEEQANVDNALAKLAFEQAEVKRQQSLVAKNLISATELDETISNRNIAQANLAAAKARQARIKQQLAFTQLKAPFEGIVVERLSSQGEYINTGTAIVRMVETANVEASLFAPLTAYRYLKDATLLDVKSPLGVEQAPIKAIIPVADEQSHLMEVRLDMSAIDWPIGLNLKGAVPNGESKQVVAVPRDALVLRRNSTTIFIIDNDNRAQQVVVTVGIGVGDLVEVIGEVKPGDKVVIRGAERLNSGQAVSIKDNNNSLISGNS